MTEKIRKRAGAKSKKTPERVAILLQCLTEGMPLDRSCDFAEIDRKTAYRWMWEDRDFATQVRFARSTAIKTLVGLVQVKDPWKILRSLDPKNFNDVMTFREDDSDQDEDMAGKSDEEIQEGAR
jgi:hypothetical protein